MRTNGIRKTRVEGRKRIMWRWTSRHFIAVGLVIVGAVLAGAARPARAELQMVFGDAYCHAVAAGPRYFHSGVRAAAVNPRAIDWLSDYTSLDDVTRRGLQRRTADDLAAQFARVVAARHEVDLLLSAHCDLMQEPGAAVAAIDAAGYFRDGEWLPYPPAGKIAVDWEPGFVTILERHVAEAAAPAASTRRTGVLTAYSTQPGGLAGDGLDGATNSPYTHALLAHLEDPVEVEVLFRRVAADVVAGTDGEQHPQVQTTLAVPAAVRLGRESGLSVEPVPSPGRKALVFGNAAYELTSGLENSVNDARAVAEALGRLGFEVTMVTDAGWETMAGALEAFRRNSADVDIALVFYAGQGFSRDGIDYLLPIDADPQTAETAVGGSLLLPVGRVIEAAETAGARAPIVIFDMSRYDPFAGVR